MRCEQGPTAIGLVQMLYRRPGNGQAIIGCGAAADLVEDNQRSFRCLVRDRRRLARRRRPGDARPAGARLRRRARCADDGRRRRLHASAPAHLLVPPSNAGVYEEGICGYRGEGWD